MIFQFVDIQKIHYNKEVRSSEMITNMNVNIVMKAMGEEIKMNVSVASKRSK